MDCSGGQDRDTTTSETHPYIPPQKTKNCYLTDQFDRGRCGSASDGACVKDDGTIDRGGSSACNADDYGGYCKHAGKFWESRGMTFAELKGDALLNRYNSGSSGSSGSSGTDESVRRALRDQERKMTNRIRELQLMGKDPLVRGRKAGTNDDNDDNDDNEVHNSVSSILFNIGMASSILIFIASLSFILIHKNII